jgi:hypothetical protein
MKRLRVAACEFTEPIHVSKVCLGDKKQKKVIAELLFYLLTR